MAHSPGSLARMTRKRRRNRKKVPEQQAAAAKPRRRNRRRRAASQAGQAGMARSTRTGNQAVDSAVESGRDYLLSVKLPATLDGTNFKLLEIDLSPHTLENTRLAYMAKCWEKYRYTRCELEFVPAASSAVGGQLLGYFEMDADAPAPSTVDSAARTGSAHQGAVVFNVYTPTTIRMPTRLGLNDFFTGHSEERRLGVQAVMRVLALAGASGPGVTTEQAVGSFYLRWSIRFEGRQLDPTQVAAGTDAASLLGLMSYDEHGGTTPFAGAYQHHAMTFYGLAVTARWVTNSALADVRYGTPYDGTVEITRQTGLTCPWADSVGQVVVFSHDGRIWVCMMAKNGYWYEVKLSGATQLEHLTALDARVKEQLEKHLLPVGLADGETSMQEIRAQRASRAAERVATPVRRRRRPVGTESRDDTDEDLSDLFDPVRWEPIDEAAPQDRPSRRVAEAARHH